MRHILVRRPEVSVKQIAGATDQVRVYHDARTFKRRL